MGRLLIQFAGTNTTKALSETLPKNTIIVDEDLHQLRLHDGTTRGGHIIGGSGGGGVPVGTIIPFAGNSIPEGYLLCDGSAISRTDYATLFAVIGTIYGSGDGNSTFNLPYCPYEWKLTHVGLNSDRNRWYRRWSDSFIEQGGQGANSYAQFPWTMANANYAASIINVDEDTGTQGVGLVSRSSTGFYLQRYTGGTYNVVWFCSGQGADSQSPWAAKNIIKYI